MNIIPLRRAVLCGNCDSISDANGHACPHCKSPSLVSLLAILQKRSAA